MLQLKLSKDEKKLTEKVEAYRKLCKEVFGELSSFLRKTSSTFTFLAKCPNDSQFMNRNYQQQMTSITSELYKIQKLMEDTTLRLTDLKSK